MYSNQRQLTFIHSFSAMANDALPKLIFTARVYSNAKKGSISVWSELIYSLDLPGLSQLMDSPWSRTSWKKHVECKLCLQEPEDQAHFIARCPRLEAVRSQLLLTAPPPQRYNQHQLGQTWSRDSEICQSTFSTTCASTGTRYFQDHTDSAHNGLLSHCGGYKEEVYSRTQAPPHKAAFLLFGRGLSTSNPHTSVQA